MTAEDLSRLRRELQALATVNRQLHAQVADVAPARRSALAKEWIAGIKATPVEGDPVLVRRRGEGVWVLEGGRRRAVRSGLLAAALEAALGGRTEIDQAAFDEHLEGPPVEVLEGPAGPPFVIVGRRRLPLRGLPLTAPVTAEDVLDFPEGTELRLGAGGAPADVGRPSVDAPLPTFLIIGAQKSATRWLRSNLGAHPEVFTPPHEPSFFNHEDAFHERGIAWYRQQFEGWAGEPLLGESTPGYMMWRHSPELVARRIAKVVPDVRLLAILRDPIDRAQSAMIHHIKRGRIADGARLIDLVRATPPKEDQLGLVAGGWYATSLRPYLDQFGDQLLVLLHDDLADDALGVYRQALEHIGADPTYRPAELEQVRFSNQAKAARPQDVTPEERLELWELFRDDVADLEGLIGRDLSAWTPAPAPAPTDQPGPDRMPHDDGALDASGVDEPAAGAGDAASGDDGGDDE